MDKRRSWPFQLPGTAQSLKPWILIFFAVSIIMLAASAITLIILNYQSQEIAGSPHGAFLIFCATGLWVTLAAALILVLRLIRKYSEYAGGPLKHITEAMDKMSKGDLGWKLTMHRKAELGDVADSISNASQALAHRINNIRVNTQQLNEVEDYLIDTLGADNFYNPYAIKALRKLKITTTRLNSHISEFQLSAFSHPESRHPQNSIPPDRVPSQQL